MPQALESVASSGAFFGVKNLQRGLNSFKDKTPLKEDGELGPKTVSRIKNTLVNQGLDKVNQNVGFAGFTSLIDNNRNKPVEQEELSETMSAISPIGGLSLQKSLNKVGESKPGYAPLKEDNDVGPKTTNIFNEIKGWNEDKLKESVRVNFDPRRDEEQENQPEN